MMRKQIYPVLLVSVVIWRQLLALEWVNAQERYGAYIEKVSQTSMETGLKTFLVPPRANLVMVWEDKTIVKAIQADISGEIITEIPHADKNAGKISCFYSEERGLSAEAECLALFAYESDKISLLPPTIYASTSISLPKPVLGFVGKSYPLTDIELQIDGTNNKKYIYKSLANASGEWQLSISDLPEGDYQISASGKLNEEISSWSQVMNVSMYGTIDSIVSNTGKQARKGLEKALEILPEPIRNVASGLDQQSNLSSKYVLPVIITIANLTQSGIVLQQLILLLYQTGIGLLALMGVRKQVKRESIVYNAITKKPLSRAIVRLYQVGTHQLVETDVTSASGRFAFLPRDGYYYLRISKPGYVYPSQLVFSQTDGTIANVYSGGEILINQNNPTISVAIPMDPETITETLKMKWNRLYQMYLEPLNVWLLWLGLFLAFLSYTREPNKLNLMVLSLYLFGLSYQIAGNMRLKREYGLVLSSRGKPLPDVELILTDLEYNRLVARRVTDAQGRYQFLAPPGNYNIRVVSSRYELVNSIGGYKGEKILVSGERGKLKHLIPKIVVREV